MSLTAAQDESVKGLEQPSDSDDTSDYFADGETSSCKSSHLDVIHTNLAIHRDTLKCTRETPILQGTFNR